MTSKPELNQGPADLQSTALTTEPYNCVQSNQHKICTARDQPPGKQAQATGDHDQNRNNKTLVTMERADMQMTLETLFLEPLRSARQLLKITEKGTNAENTKKRLNNKSSVIPCCAKENDFRD